MSYYSVTKQRTNSNQIDYCFRLIDDEHVDCDECIIYLDTPSFTMIASCKTRDTLIWDFSAS